MRLDPPTSLLCVIDVQEKLLPAVPEGDRVVAAAGKLAEAAGLLGVGRVLTEQYPRGLGRTAAGLAARLPPPIEKLAFSCCGAEAFAACLPEDLESVLLCGLETHVCVAQTALDLLARGLAVFIAVDAVASRHPVDHQTALRRLDGAGAILTTVEGAIFEWCRTAAHPQFQAVRKIVLSG